VGASGLLIVLGVGALPVAGPVINAIASAVLGAGVMAGSALAARVGIALHRIGIPEDKLEHLPRAIMDGKMVCCESGGLPLTSGGRSCFFATILSQHQRNSE